MVLVAQIIVDVPLMQTDRPYSYLVPESMYLSVKEIVYCKALLLASRSRRI